MFTWKHKTSYRFHIPWLQLHFFTVNCFIFNFTGFDWLIERDYQPSCRHNCRPAEKADTTACFSICQSVNTGRRGRVKYLRVEANRSYERTEKQLHFWISLVFGLVAKCNARFNKNVSQLKSDIRLQPLFLLLLMGGVGWGGKGVWTLPLDPPLPFLRKCCKKLLINFLWLFVCFITFH